MRIGIDFGTTRAVVAAVDRGNYPIITFEAPDGSSADWYPPIAAVRGAERRYGFEAWAVQAESGWTVVRSVKSLLAHAGLGSRVAIGDESVPVPVLLSELAGDLRRSLLEHSTLEVRAGEPLEAMLGVPANAHSNQRFLTAEAFREAGFTVVGILNEPSAASIELGHLGRQSGDELPRRSVLVYDFGGGTFDASLVELDHQVHSVTASEGLAALGGDDFDELLADLALETAGLGHADRDDLDDAALFRLHETCRRHKEALHPNARRIVLELDEVRAGWPTVTVPVATYYERCQPLVDRTISTVDALLEHAGLQEGDGGGSRVDTVYVIGGASELPVVARRLRDRFGRRLRRSSHARSSTAIGLAIQADREAGYVLRDRFTRYFGVWREADGGATAIFDPLFPRGVQLPGAGDPPLVVTRRYRPAHNLGHYRYLECSQVAPGGQPTGDLTHWDEIRFPFDPLLAQRADLASVEVRHDPSAAAQEIEETCECESGGTVTVTLTNLTAGYSRAYRLGHWGARTEPIRPARRRPKKG